MPCLILISFPPRCLFVSFCRWGSDSAIWFTVENGAITLGHWGGDYAGYTCPDANMVAGEWTLVTVIMNASSAAFYRNHVLACTGENFGTMARMVRPQPLIGAYPNMANPFIGRIASFQLHKRAWETQEVTFSYQYPPHNIGGENTTQHRDSEHDVTRLETRAMCSFDVLLCCFGRSVDKA
jgi:hypothetical protein